MLKDHHGLLPQQALIAGLLFVVAGCSSVSYEPSEPSYRPGPSYPAPSESPRQEVPADIRDTPKLHTPDETTPAPEPTVARGAEAIDSLAVTAAQDYNRGDYQAAIATAERGLRINRRSPDLYLVLAQSYLKLGQQDRARSFVGQGLRYAAPGTPVYHSLQRINEIVGF